MSNRYTCTCDPVKYEEQGDLYVYPRQIVVDLPDWTIAIKERLRMNYPPNVCIDSCIVELIKDLWSKGVETTGCCCGHGVMKGWVSVHKAWYEDMFNLGYEQKPVRVKDGNVMGQYTFFL